jgi:hypothetical protein
MKASEKLRDCQVCGNPVFAKKYQKDSCRVCSPACAHRLAVKEHPDLGPRFGSVEELLS